MPGNSKIPSPISLKRDFEYQIMSWSEFSRDQKLVTVFTVLTGLMHLAFSPTWFEDDALGINLGVLFIINGIGYFALLYLLYFGDQMEDNKDLVTYLLGAWTIASILGWILFHPADTLLDSSISNKIIEVLLLVFLYLDFNTSDISGSAMQAAETTAVE